MWTLERPDGLKLNRLAATQTNNSIKCTDLDQFTEKVTEAIIKCCKKIYPPKEDKEKQTLVPRWTEECGRKKIGRKEALTKEIDKISNDNKRSQKMPHRPQKRFSQWKNYKQH